jgi:hypothetical protein
VALIKGEEKKEENKKVEIIKISPENSHLISSQELVYVIEGKMTLS